MWGPRGGTFIEGCEGGLRGRNPPPEWHPGVNMVRNATETNKTSWTLLAPEKLKSC